MPKITIVFDDSNVGVDNEFYSPVDVSAAPMGLHALQWNGSKGWIEYCMDDDFNKPTNTFIDELPSWVSAILAGWESAKQAAADAKP